VIFNEQIADVAERFPTKGADVYGGHQLQNRKWTDQGGQEHHMVEVARMSAVLGTSMLSAAAQ
jgi:single-strand DNA-binding protein